MFGTPAWNTTQKVEFGTAVRLSSANGNILAVGAPHHSYNFSTANPANLNDEGGAVFLYKFNGTDWNLLSSFFGDPGEQMGDYLALSAGGSRIAIRRYNNTLKSINQVEVYGISINGTTTKRGSNLSCGANGNSVSLSPCGSRIAVGCHTFNSGRGLVEIFDWSAGHANWVSIGKIQMNETLNNNAFFGWSLSFDATGNRLAISAPKYDWKRGLVRVYDYVGGSIWNQVGADIRGLNEGEMFGFSMDISGDGLSVVAGAPLTNLSGISFFCGAVSVFGLDNGTSLWRPIGKRVAGVKTLDRLGRSVSIARNGRRIAASSYLFGRGDVKLLDFVGGQWVTTGAITGTSNQDRFGFGLLSVTLTADGSRFASGSVWENNAALISVGRVRVYDDVTASNTTPSISPSIIKSSFPSTSPSDTVNSLTAHLGIPLSNPTEKLEPSDFPTIVEPTLPMFPPSASFLTPTDFPSANSLMTTLPTLVLSKFDWDLERIGDAVVSFSGLTSDAEITLNYNISNRLPVITVWDKNCFASVLPSTVGVTSQITIESPTHSNLEVSLNVKQDTIVGSALWSADGFGVGFVNLCVRVDLVLDDLNLTSVNFYEQKIYVSIGLQQGFSVVDINLNRDEANTTNYKVNVNYDILACQCNEYFICVNDVLVHGSDVFICVYSNTSNVKVAEISDLTFRQDELSFSPIFNFTEDAITTVVVTPQGALIRSQMRSIFFGNLVTGNVFVEGTAVLSFAEGSYRALYTSRFHESTAPSSRNFRLTMMG